MKYIVDLKIDQISKKQFDNINFLDFINYMSEFNYLSSH